MKPRHLILGGTLLAAAGLALFGDKTPSGEVAEAVDRRAAPRAAAGPAAGPSAAGASAGVSAAAAGGASATAPASVAVTPTAVQAAAGGTPAKATGNGAPVSAPAPTAANPAAPAGPTVAAASPAAAASAPPAASVARGGAVVAKAGSSAILRLIPRAQLIGEAGEATFKSGEGVFLGQNWNPPPPPPVAPPPPPPPSAPPLPYSYIGKAVADGAWEVYLARGDRTYIVQLKTVLDGTYRVDKIAPPELTITYLPLNQVQQLNIGAID